MIMLLSEIRSRERRFQGKMAVVARLVIGGWNSGSRVPDQIADV